MLRRLISVLVVLAVSMFFSVVASSLAAGDANQASCPASTEASPGFHAYLPDCRAYEMVTPPFKDGVQNNLYAASDDGSRVLVQSEGAFAGTENGSGGGEDSLYELSRTGSGWTVSALSPPGSQFAFNALFASSADLARTLWATRRSSQSIYAKDLYVREPDGAFVKVGPMVPPAVEGGPPAGAYQIDQNYLYEYAGASNDLSHVLFVVHQENGGWPGDTTSGTEGSLYEYVGVGNTRPQLVGVNAEGHLIGRCGTNLGASNSEDVYNAISANGETVFFTPSNCAIAEVYARLGQIETVAISEPSSAQCAECNTSTPTSAEFQGASADGSKAFFFTEQELLPGATTNNLYEYDFDNPAGKKIVRVSSGAAAPKVQGVVRVSEDGSHVYFVAQEALTGANGRGQSPVAGADNLYVFERDSTYPGGRTAFVAMLCSGEERSGTVSGVASCPSASLDQQDWNLNDQRPVQATPDGRFLVFESVADLTPGDTSTEPQVFEYDALSEELVRVSIGQAGYAAGMANANAHGSSITRQGYNSVFRPTTAGRELAVSADGSTVVFASAGALVAAAETAAAAGAQSVYGYRSAGSISNGDVYLISDGVNTSPASQLGLDPSGGDVFFQTADPLLAQDVDTQLDIYDARAGGGFPPPGTPAVCEDEACQGAPSTQSSFGAPASVSVPGGANVASPSPVAVAKPMSRAEKLARALRECRKRPKRRRAACERQARRAYGPTHKSKTSRNGGK